LNEFLVNTSPEEMNNFTFDFTGDISPFVSSLGYILDSTIKEISFSGCIINLF